MADPGTILSVVSLGIQVTQGLAQYWNSFHGYDEEIESLISATEHLKAHLQNIDDVLKRSTSRQDPETARFRDQLLRNVHASNGAIKALEAEYKKLQRDGSGTRAAFRNFGRKATYHFRKESLSSLRTIMSEALRNLRIGIDISQLDQLDVTQSLVNEVKKQQDLDKIKAWLSPPDHSVKHKLAREQCQEGTAEWIVREPKFQYWLANGSILWLTGNAGSGKTILSSAIIENARDTITSNSDCAVAYFHFSFNDSLHGSAEKVTRSFISQLAFRDRDCSPVLKNLYDASQSRTDGPTLQQLISTLQEITRPFQTLFIILDALEEAPQQLGLLRLLESLFSPRLNNIHMCLLSRPSLEIAPKLEELKPVRLEMNTNEINKDILTLIRAKLKNDPKLLDFPESHAKIETTLTARADGMFLLADSQLNDLRNCITTSHLDRTLESLPTSLDEQWQRCLNKARNSPFFDLTVRMLTWLCFSNLPMQANELIDALAMPDEWCDGFDIESNRIKNPGRLLEIGADLVQMDQSPDNTGETKKTIVTYRLAHSSVKDWLNAESTAARIFRNLSPFSEAKAHGKIAQDCMQYLTEFDKKTSWHEKDFSQWPLAYYAAEYWRDHLSKSEYCQSSVDWACKLLLNDQARRNWRGILVKLGDEEDAEESEDTDPDRVVNEHNLAERHRRLPLAHAACFGLDPVVLQLKDQHGQKVNESGSCRSALEMAVRFNHMSTVKILLDSGADIDQLTADDTPISILGKACDFGSLELVTHLLDQGATDKQVDLKSSYSALAFAAARYDDDDKVVRLLLRRGHQITIPSGRFGMTALHRAAGQLNTSIVQALLSFGADRTIVDIDGELPLHRAVRQRDCSLELAITLRFEGVDAVKDRNGYIPLYASISGNEAVCEMLVDSASTLGLHEPNLTDAFFHAVARGFLKVARFLRKKGARLENGDQIAIIEASANGHLNVVEYLLQEGAPVNARDTNGFNPFLSAIRDGNEEVWRFLVTKAADIHVTTTESHCNACHMTAALEDTDTLRWLLDHGVNGHNRDSNGWMPLHRAAISGYKQALKLLSEYGADLNVRVDNKSRSSIAHIAAWHNQVEVLQWLSGTGAQMDALDQLGFTPFLSALSRGHLGCVEFLAKYTPHYKSQRTGSGLTPLAVVAETGSVGVAQWLIENGTDLNESFEISGDLELKDYFPLLHAVLCGQFGLTKFLLQKGANANLCDQNGWTPLLWAANYRPFAYTKLLIQYGARFRDIRIYCGDDALMCAIENPDLDILRYFLAEKIDLNVENQYGFSPLLSAANIGHVEHVKILHKAGAKYCQPNQQTSHEIFADDIRHTSVWYSIRDLGVYYKGLNVLGRYTPLMVSAFNGYMELVEYFLMHFPEAKSCIDKDGNDALTYACCGGHAKVAEALIDSGLDKTRPNRAKRTVQQEVEKFLESLNEDMSSEEDDEARQKYEKMQQGIDQVLLFLKEGGKGELFLPHEDDNESHLGVAPQEDSRDDPSSSESVGKNQETRAKKADESGSVDSVASSTQCHSTDEGGSDEDDLFLPALSRQGTELSGHSGSAAEEDKLLGEDVEADPRNLGIRNADAKPGI